MPVSLNSLNTVVGTKATVTDFSVTQNAAGVAALSYDNAGAFSYTPPDVSTSIALTDLQVLTAAASGGGALTYNNTNGNFTFTPADTATALTDLGITDGTANQVLTTDGAGNFTFQDAQAPIAIDDPSTYLNVNGSTSSFTIEAGHSANSIFVLYNGIVLVPTTDYTVSGTTVTTTFTPIAGSDIVIRYLPI